jgi:hypothetical protein
VKRKGKAKLIKGKSFFPLMSEWFQFPNISLEHLAILAFYSGQLEWEHPSHKDIAKGVLVSQKRIGKLIEDLVKMGALFRIGASGRKVFYDIEYDMSKWKKDVLKPDKRSKNKRNFDKAKKQSLQKWSVSKIGRFDPPKLEELNSPKLEELNSPKLETSLLLKGEEIEEVEKKKKLLQIGKCSVGTTQTGAQLVAEEPTRKPEIEKTTAITLSSTETSLESTKNKKQYLRGPKSNFKHTEDDYRLAGDMAKFTFQVSAVHQKMSDIKQKWHILEEAEEVRKMRTIDNLKPGFIAHLIYAVSTDEFWGKNCRTIKKMRKKTREGDKYIWEAIRDNSEYFRRLRHEKERRDQAAKKAAFLEATKNIRVEDIPF